MINIKSKTVWFLIYDQHHTLDNVGFGNLSQYQPSVFCFNKKRCTFTFTSYARHIRQQKFWKCLSVGLKRKFDSLCSSHSILSAYPSHSRNVNCSDCRRVCLKSELITPKKHCQQEQQTQGINLTWFSALTRSTPFVQSGSLGRTSACV